jgi:Tfp pilus assembly protein PilN
MIRINLLPEEMRTREKTPLARIVVTLVGTFVIVTGASVYAYAHFGLLHEARSRLDRSRSELASLEPEAQYADDLLHEKKDFDKRSEIIQTIGNSRILWSRKCDQLLDITHNGGDADRHFVWLRSLSMKPSTSKDTSTAGTVVLSGFSATSKLQKLSDFHADLKSSAFFDAFSEIDNPSGKVSEFKDNMTPSSAWDFTFNLKLKPTAPDKSSKTKPGAAKSPAAAAAPGNAKQ